MSVIIKGMDMPKSCRECGLQRLTSLRDEVCIKTYKPIREYIVGERKPDWCPLEELPEDAYREDFGKESDHDEV